ncbi:thiamine phosphate synthase [Luteolibacter flavescens]|uniref:Thiamine-phosphate synthase n=1 Tax=Luteolibacter flavescens TaxID=1859460 RepID=A0ABT3FL01_9BACT|nr:thiamine phosphate synthase [Luteolibacter flavescens]MCW1883864.1 thiamine phosphate synthase [Luteolibacter flavescens]
MKLSGQLYAILDLGYVSAENAETVTGDLLAGGADLLQLRAKGHEPGEIERLARLLLPLCREAGVPFIVNDYPAIAAAVGADGIHIGQDDGTLAAVQEIVGPDMLVGRSTHSPDQARAALAEGFDYIGFGPLFPTPTKLGRPGIGIENVAAVQAEVGSQIPVFCIGGIKRDNLPQVLEAGARNVVIVSDLLTAEDVVGATAMVKRAIADCGLRTVD